MTSLVPAPSNRSQEPFTLITFETNVSLGQHLLYTKKSWWCDCHASDTSRSPEDHNEKNLKLGRQKTTEISSIGNAWTKRSLKFSPFVFSNKPLLCAQETLQVELVWLQRSASSFSRPWTRMLTGSSRWTNSSTMFSRMPALRERWSCRMGSDWMPSLACLKTETWVVWVVWWISACSLRI